MFSVPPLVLSFARSVRRCIVRSKYTDETSFVRCSDCLLRERVFGGDSGSTNILGVFWQPSLSHSLSIVRWAFVEMNYARSHKVGENTLICPHQCYHLKCCSCIVTEVQRKIHTPFTSFSAFNKDMIRYPRQRGLICRTLKASAGICITLTASAMSVSKKQNQPQHKKTLSHSTFVG